VRENWRGGGDVVQLAEAIAGLAPKLLPKRIRRVLSARIETVPGDLREALSAARNSETLVRELPEEESAAGASVAN
jgi:hypothetical protein